MNVIGIQSAAVTKYNSIQVKRWITRTKENKQRRLRYVFSVKNNLFCLILAAVESSNSCLDTVTQIVWE